MEAVLRRVAEAPADWPDDATRLSYPDWIVERLSAELGRETALLALETMNEPAQVHERADGYVQDLSSQWVASHVGAAPGETVADLCAAPGGKATALASQGAFVVAGDVRPARARSGGRRSGRSPHLPFADPPMSRKKPFDSFSSSRRRLSRTIRSGRRLLVECLEQRQLLTASTGVLRAGGRLVYCVCTMTRAETTDVDEWLREAHPELEVLPPPGPPWTPLGRGALLLPQAAGTDGMFVLTLALMG